MAGRIIGNYQIQDELDHGNLGALYRGRHMNLNTDVVIREIHLATFPVSTRVQLKARFRRELFIQAQLNHPSIARVYQSFVKGDNYYVVSEYVPGMSLRELLEREGLPTAPQALYICKQALAALEYAHSLRYLDESDVQRVGVIHRDIKPSNLVIDGQGKLKITDFGIVRMPDSQTLAPPIFQPGTMEYMAPEQVRGLEPDARADIYSLGVTFYQVLTGHLPYSRTKAAESLRLDMIPDHEPPLISEFRSDVNPALANIFARSIARNPGSRFQSAGEFLAAIRQYERSYNQVESPSKPFSARPVKNLNEGAYNRPSMPTAHPPPAPPIQTAPINSQAEKRHSIDRNNRKTLPMPPGQSQSAPTESKKDDSGGLSRRRVTSPLPKPDRMNIPAVAEPQPSAAQASTRSDIDDEPFFIEAGSSGNRVGWVVAAALTVIAVFAGLYLFVLKEGRPDQSLVINSPASATDITSAAAAAVNTNPIQPAVSTALTPADIERLNQAREADRQGKFNTAISLYGSFLQSAPKSAESASISEQLDRLRKFVAHLNAAKSAFNRGDYRTARDNYSDALKLRPYSRLVQNGIAECNSRLSDGSGSPGTSTRPRRTAPPIDN